jgi:hypothetical protein
MYLRYIILTRFSRFAHPRPPVNPMTLGVTLCPLPVAVVCLHFLAYIGEGGTPAQ